MKKTLFGLLIFQLLFVFTLTGCGMFSSDSRKYDDEFDGATGKWLLQNDDSTYFTFDGSKGNMKFSYVEDGVSKYSGTFRAIYRGNGKDILTPLCFMLVRGEVEDWLNCYVEGFDESFTQFTIMSEEEDLGVVDSTVYTHIYRISELPYKMGTYIIEGSDYKTEGSDYSAADTFIIPSGVYTLETGEAFTFMVTKPRQSELFQYKNKDVVVEGVLTVSADKKTIYLYIENDPYSKVTKADKELYDTTVSAYYPPDFYLRGDFSNPDYFVIDGLYHHSDSQTEIVDEVWSFGTYVK